MKVISVIVDLYVIKKIPKHLGLWQINPRPPPKETLLGEVTHRQAGQTKITEYRIDYSTSQLPSSECPPLINPISGKNEGQPHHPSTLLLTHKAKSPKLRP